MSVLQNKHACLSGGQSSLNCLKESNDYKQYALNLIDDNWDKALQEYVETKQWLQKMKVTMNKKLCVFCVGVLGIDAYRMLKNEGIIVDFFSDNNADHYNKIIIDDKKCISLSELKKNKENIIVIIASSYIPQIYTQLQEEGFTYLLNYNYFTNSDILQFLKQHGSCYGKKEIMENVESLFDVLADERSKAIVYFKLKQLFEFRNSFNKEVAYENICSDHQYIPNDVTLNLKEGAFVDCGAYTGDTLANLENFIEWGKQQYICYELDKENYECLNENICAMDREKQNNIFAFNFGVGASAQQIYYQSDGTSSKISCNQNGEIGKIISISEHLAGRKISYIKMDIEGSEMPALQGASALIKEQKPVLGICIYHKFTDLWEIPLYIKQLNSNYKIYIRHHTNLFTETVCYAVI